MRKIVRGHTSSVVSLVEYECACGSGDRPGDEQLNDHSHFSLMSSGAVAVTGGRSEALGDPLHAIFNPRGVTYRVRHPGGAAHSYVVLQPSEQLLDEAAASTRLTEAVSSIPCNAAALSAHVTLRRLLRAVPRDELALDEAALEVIVALSKQRSERNRPSRDSRKRLARMARERIASRPEESVGVSAIARDIGCSPFHLARAFREEMGHTLRGYRIRLRLARALHAMAEGEASLGKIASSCGFASHSHMSTCFSKILGLSPSRVRGALNLPPKGAGKTVAGPAYVALDPSKETP
jgi:AraC family transcriptional regulator